MRRIVDTWRYRRVSRDLRRAVARAGTPPDFAVVAHVFYGEQWSLLRDRLALIAEPYELVVTIPDTARSLVDLVRRDVPHAIVLIVPNRGRDVLPFLRVAETLDRLGVRGVLKVHTKSATTSDSAQQFFQEVLGVTVPSASIAGECRSRVVDGSAALIGAHDHFVPLWLMVGGERHRLEAVVRRHVGTPPVELRSRFSGYGFFAGTMFWASLPALRELLRVPTWRFDPERGRKASTMAHAIERAICVIPQLRNLPLFALDEHGVHPLAPHDTRVPVWARGVKRELITVPSKPRRLIGPLKPLIRPLVRRHRERRQRAAGMTAGRS